MQYKSINIPKKLHTEMKVKCAILEISISEYIIGLIRKNLDKNSPEEAAPPKEEEKCSICERHPCECPPIEIDCPDCGNIPCVCEHKYIPKDYDYDKIYDKTEDDIFGGVAEGISGRPDNITKNVKYDKAEK